MKLIVRAGLLAAVLQVLLAAHAAADYTVTITSPKEGDTFDYTVAQIGCSGGGERTTPFVLYATANGTIYSSVSVTPNLDGEWGANLPRPGNNWPANTQLSIFAEANNMQLSEIVHVNMKKP